MILGTIDSSVFVEYFYQPDFLGEKTHRIPVWFEVVKKITRKWVVDQTGAEKHPTISDKVYRLDPKLESIL
jgi:hypothetical protein